MVVSLIVAVSNNNVIGNNGKIPWNIKGEQTRFKELTTGKTIIMGRKTFESIGRPLSNRRTIVISTTENIVSDNCITVKSLQEAFDLTKENDEVFIAGGGKVYKDALSYADKIYITVIEKYIEGDVYFPDINEHDFEKTREERIEGEIPYTYYTYQKIKKPKYIKR